MFSRLFRDLPPLWRRSNSGSSAVEFGLIAPMLMFGAILMVDVGMAVRERMELDHVVRAGAESAMIKHDEGTVLKVMQQTAAMSFSDFSASSETSSINLTTSRYCVCGTTVASCSVACSNSLPPDVLFDLNARRTYSGMLLPDINFNAQMQVQLR